MDEEPTIEQPLVFLRWALIAALSYMILLGQSGLVTRPSALCYVGLLLASNLVIPRFPYRNPRTFGSVLLGLDTVFVLVGVMLSDSSSQDLLIGYFLCIVMASFGDSERRIAGAGFLVSGVYSFWIFHNARVGEQATVFIRLPFLFITTIFYGYMMQRLRSEHARRLNAEDRVRSLDCLLQVTRSFSSSLVTEEVLDRVAATLRATLGVDCCTIELVAHGGSDQIAGVAAEALAARHAVCRTDDSGKRSHTVLALPIVHDVEPLGVLLVGTERSGEAFRTEEIELCQVIANAAAPALKNARQHETLAEVDRAKSEFLSNLSHELRTPLNAIVGFTGLAADRVGGGDPELHEMVERIAKNASEMAKRVESLLQLSVATLGRERKEIARVDLPALVQRALSDAERLARPGTVEFGLEIDPTIREVYTDGDKLERVLATILLNAVKFTERGSVHVVAALATAPNAAAECNLPRPLEPWERLLSLRVVDTGIGIANDELTRIFGDFHQVKGGLNRPYGGLGIGLALARRLTELLGGVIRVESRPAEGSRFEVLVPVGTAR
jgi:signal transduction histidine kinase